MCSAVQRVKYMFRTVEEKKAGVASYSHIAEDPQP